MKITYSTSKSLNEVYHPKKNKMIQKILQISKAFALSGFMLFQSCESNNDEVEISSDENSFELDLENNDFTPVTMLNFSSGRISDDLFSCDNIRVFRVRTEDDLFSGFTRSNISFSKDNTFNITSRKNNDVLDNGTWSFTSNNQFSITFATNTQFSGVYNVSTFLDNRDRVRARFKNSKNVLNFAFLCDDINTTPESEEGTTPAIDPFFTPFLTNSKWKLIQVNGNTTNNQVGEIFNFNIRLRSDGTPSNLIEVTRESDSFRELYVATRSNRFPSVSESFILNLSISTLFKGLFDMNVSADNSTIELMHVPEIPARTITSLIFKAVQ